MVGLNGTTCENTFCPSDEAFQLRFTDWVMRVAEAGTKMIMLDDDYRLSYRPCGMGCCCDFHMREFGRRLGRAVDRDDLATKIFTGGKNPYRDAWLDMGRDMLTDLAQKIRAKVDLVDERVRLGFCAVLSTWDIDGVDAISLAKVFAGKTRPFLRTIGAPYWNVNHDRGTRLGQIIELTRMQRKWCEDEDIELFSEGDVYPRPRYSTPAAFLEGFDLALRADGGMDGILKYVVDYTSKPDYERGYIDRAVRNRPAYEWIAAHMSEKRAVGVRVICPMRRIRNADFPDRDVPEQLYTDALFVLPEYRLLCDLSIPIAYGGDGVCVAFGENGKYLTDRQLESGVVLDAVAAMHLMNRGVDVGIQSMRISDVPPRLEHYLAEDEHVIVDPISDFYQIEPRPSARVVTRMVTDGEICGAFTYENAAGQRFLVYPFHAFFAGKAHGYFRNYCRQRQLIRDLEWLGRKPLPAVCAGNPDLYLQCKRDEKSLAIGLWNFFEDSILQPTIHLSETFREAAFFGCRGQLSGRELRLEGEISPYTFAGIELRN